MRCQKCGAEFDLQPVCPKCGAALPLGGHEQFIQKVTSNQMRLSDIFLDVFKKHPKGSVDRCLRHGNVGREELLRQWQKPWLFLRVFAFLGLLVLLMSALVEIGGGAYAFVPIVFFGVSIVSFSVLTFFWEMDISCNVSLLEMVMLVLVGGVVSVILGLGLNTQTASLTTGAWFAGITEEPSKLLVCVGFMLLRRRKYTILDGLLIGAAVATGFSFIESTGYVLMYSTNAAWQVIAIRNVASLSGHIFYTAPFIGALCWATDNGTLTAHAFLSPRFLLFFALGIGLHMFGNTDIDFGTIVYLNVPGYISDVPLISVKNLLKMAVQWTGLAYLLREGVKQMYTTPTGYTQHGEEKAAQAVTGSMGVYAGQRFALTQGVPLVIGRDPSQCHLIFDEDTKGISRRHCTVVLEGTQVSVYDNGSSYGTYLDNGTKLLPQQKVLLAVGQGFGLGADRKQRFEVTV